MLRNEPHCVHVTTTGLLTPGSQSFAVFLAYYLNSGQFEGTSPIVFAFVGGLAFSIGMPADTTLADET